MKRFICLLCLLLLLTGCAGEKAPTRPTMRFNRTPVTLIQEDFVLQGALTFAGVDGVQFTAESPEAVRGFVFTLAQGEYRIACGEVELPAAVQGCVPAFLDAVRAFDLEELRYENGRWQLAGEEVFLTTDESGTPQRIWSDAAGWQADFG